MRSEYGPWEWDGVRRAGVSSFGVGGTNVHVVLEEAPAVSAPSATRPVLRCCCCRPEPPRRCEQSRSALAAELSGPDEAEPVRRRLHPCGPPEGEHPDGGGRQRPAARGRGPAGRRARQRLRRRIRRRATNRIRTESFSSFRARVLSTSGWLAASTSPSRCSPSTSIECAAGFGEELGIDLRAEVFDGTATEPGAHRPGPTGAVRRGIRAGEVDRVLRRSPGGVGGTQHRRVRRGHHRGRLRPADGGQGGVDARTPDARRTPRGHGRGGAEPRCHRRVPFARRRSRHGQRSGQLRRRGIRGEHPRIPGSPRRSRGSSRVGSAPRTHSIRG